MNLKKKKKLQNLLLNLLFLAGSVVMLVPFFLAFVNSFKSVAESQRLRLSLPGVDGWHFENYSTVIEKSNFLRSFSNGMIYACSTCLCIVALASLSAFILCRRNDRIAKLVQSYFTLGILVPGALIPTFLVMQALGLINTYPGLILIYICGAIPQAIFLYSGFISSVPRELDEAAFIDGAGVLRTFFQIIFPTLKPITATVVVITFMTVWNDFQTQLYFGTTKMRALPISVYQFFGRYSQSWNLVFADIVLTMVPVMVVYFCAQKYIIAGMTSGAVKG